MVLMTVSVSTIYYNMNCTNRFMQCHTGKRQGGKLGGRQGGKQGGGREGSWEGGREESWEEAGREAGRRQGGKLGGRSWEEAGREAGRRQGGKQGGGREGKQAAICTRQGQAADLSTHTHTHTHTPVAEDSSSQHQGVLVASACIVDPLQVAVIPQVAVTYEPHQSVRKRQPCLHSKLSLVHSQFHIL